MDEEFLNFNISGSRFKFAKQMLNSNACSFFDILFEYLKNPSSTKLPSGVYYFNDEFFAQRSPQLFHIVLQNCLTGKLHIPPNACKEVIMNELAFWELDFKHLCECCRADWDVNEDINENDIIRMEKPKTKYGRFKYKMWLILENEENSFLSKIFAFLSLFFIFLSTVNLVVSSLPELQFCPANGTNNIIYSDTCDEANLTAINETCESSLIYQSDNLLSGCEGTKVFQRIDTTCVVWFTLELIIRAWFSPNIWAFCKNPLNIIDALSILPYYLEVILLAVALDSERMHNIYRIFVFLRILRTLRVLRVLKLARYVQELRILAGTIVSARNELGMLVMFVTISVLIFGSLMYDLEKDAQDTLYTSIPASCWYSIVTLTTVGYGDVVPRTLGGKIVGSVACVTGVLVLALPVTVLVEHFNHVYKTAKNRRAVIEAKRNAAVEEKRRLRKQARQETKGKFQQFQLQQFQVITNWVKIFSALNKKANDDVDPVGNDNNIRIKKVVHC